MKSFIKQFLNASQERQLYTLSELPFHLFESDDFDRLVKISILPEFIKLSCEYLTPRDTLERLNLGLSASRRIGNHLLGAIVLAVWGIVYNKTGTRHEDFDKFLKAGQVDKAIQIAVESFATQTILEDQNVTSPLANLLSQALEYNMLAAADKILKQLINNERQVSAIPLRMRMQLVEAMLKKGNVKALRLLYTPDSEKMALWIVCFLIGSLYVSNFMIKQLFILLKELSDPFWRGICLLILACRGARKGYNSISDILLDLELVIKSVPKGVHHDQLKEAVARISRQLSSVKSHVESITDELLICKNIKESNVEFAQFLTTKTECNSFSFIPNNKVIPRPSSTISLILLDCVGRAIESNYFDRNEVETRKGYLRKISEIFCKQINYHNLSSQSEVNACFNQFLSQLQTYELSEAIVIFRNILLTIPPNKIPIKLISKWILNNVSSEGLVQFFKVLHNTNKNPIIGELLKLSTQELYENADTMTLTEIRMLIYDLLRFGLNEDALSWGAIYLNKIVPSSSPVKRESSSSNTSEAYKELTRLIYANLIRYDAIKAAISSGENEKAREISQHLAMDLLKSSSNLRQIMEKEFGAFPALWSYCNDRILAFAVEDIAWEMTDDDEAFELIKNWIAFDYITDDRERKRSWYFWLLMLAQAPCVSKIAQFEQNIKQAIAPTRLFEELFDGILTNKNAGKQLNPLYINIQDIEEFILLLPNFPDKIASDMAGRILHAVLDRFTNANERIAILASLEEASPLSKLQPNTYLHIAEALVPGSTPTMILRSKLRNIRIQPDIDILRKWEDHHSFDLAFQRILYEMTKRKDINELLELTEFIPRCPGKWREILSMMAECLSKNEAVIFFDETMKLIEQFNQ